jgi:putative DNA methylase
MPQQYPKRLIEVDLPIKRISAHARREKSIRHGHISTLHIWWARRPLAACRAVICAALWPDPADPLCPQDFRDKASKLITGFANAAVTDRAIGESCDHETWVKWQALVKNGGLDARKEAHWNVLRFALLDFIADFANWDNSTVQEYLDTSRALTQAAHHGLTQENGSRPLVIDPFAGGAAIPLEVLRVGADAFASDLNPVAVILNKLMLEQLAGAIEDTSQRLENEAAKVKAQVSKKLLHLYTRRAEQATAYIWARVIRCEGPGCGIEIPLLTSPWLSKAKGKYVWFEFLKEGKSGKAAYLIRSANTAPTPSPKGTATMGSATCPACGYTTLKKSVYRQLVEQRGGVHQSRCLAVVLESDASTGRRTYVLPTPEDLDEVQVAIRQMRGLINTLPAEKINPISPGKFGSGVASPTRIGCEKFLDLFTARQLLILDAFTREVANVKDPLLRLLLACAVDRLADYNSAHCRWASTGEFIGNTFGRQAISIVWTFAEVNPFADASGNWDGAISWIARVVEHVSKSRLEKGQASHNSATALPLPDDSVDALITDPPYYGAIMYGDLSDYFYVWLKRSLGYTYPDLFVSDLVPKEEEIVATPTSKGPNGENKDAAFFEARMHLALESARRAIKVSGIAVVVFAHKTTAGWEAMLSALISAGWVVTASWPVDTERQGRTNAQGTAALGSSVHLVCRPREDLGGASVTDEVGDWRDVLQALPRRIHEWMPRLSDEGVVGADAIFACLGPALEIFSRYSRVEKASGEGVPLREYLEHVWAAVAKEALAMVFRGADATGFEADARLTAMWLWTLKSPDTNGTIEEGDGEETSEEEPEGNKAKMRGFALEFDAARKIAQGLGAHLESLGHLVEVDGDQARLLPVAERMQHLFGKDEEEPDRRIGRKKKSAQLDMFAELTESEDAESAWREKTVKRVGDTTLDRVHQGMILFAAGRGEALKRFIVEDGVGRDGKFWRLAQALSALYPSSSDEKRWVDGVLARKKQLGF